MARTELTAVDMPGVLGYVGKAFAWTAADPTNGNEVALAGREVVLIRNDNAAVQTVTIGSAPDSLVRTKDEVFTDIPAGDYATGGPYPKNGWDNGGKLHIDAAAADVMLCVLRLPAGWAGR